MIACLYGELYAPFVEEIVRDVRRAAAAAGGAVWPITVEAAGAQRERCAEVHRLYILPFDPPAKVEPAETPSTLVQALFPRAEVVTPFAVQDLCSDKVATQERLVDRGIPVPDTLISSEPAEVYDFVRTHGYAVLRDRYACGSQSHIALWLDEGHLVGDSGSHQYRLDLVRQGRRQLQGVHLTYPAPFYVQRLIADIGPRWVTPGQVVRAYVIDHQIAFWTEAYRDRYHRPADWISTGGPDGRYRFLQNVSEEAQKIALRTADVIGMRMGAVDLVRTGSSGPYVLEVVVDSYRMIIDRQFKQIPEYRDFFDLDRYIAEALLIEPTPVATRRLPRPEKPRRRRDHRP